MMCNPRLNFRSPPPIPVRVPSFSPPAAARQFQLNLYGRAELTKGVEHGIRDMQFIMVAAPPFAIGFARFLVDGCIDWLLGFGSEDWSDHLNPQIALDVGNFRGSPEKFHAGVEVHFWWNTYQIPGPAAFDTDQAAASLILKCHS